MKDSIGWTGLPPRGTIVYLGDQLDRPGGKYRVLSSRGDTIKLQKGSGNPITLTLAQFRKLQGSAKDFGIDEGVLGAAGYHVGRERVPVDDRRRLLAQLMSQPHDNLPPAAGVEDWGDSNTPERLSKIANCIATFARNGYRRRPKPAEAIADWEADLEWLKAQYGDRLQIAWPSTTDPDAHYGGPPRFKL